MSLTEHIKKKMVDKNNMVDENMWVASGLAGLLVSRGVLTEDGGCHVFDVLTDAFNSVGTGYAVTILGADYRSSLEKNVELARKLESLMREMEAATSTPTHTSPDIAGETEAGLKEGGGATIHPYPTPRNRDNLN